ncbi:manganese transporter [Rhodobacteraceae bacterium W635]|uniref:metal ABC transporter solute-binding protein, Zn/Mn family n=1 Tax=Nioella halotolerans TaxID=2303578 RepID=UPI000E3C22A7|nr:manganese transporter [Rhodobacteraceae bacterium W635]
MLPRLTPLIAALILTVSAPVAQAQLSVVATTGMIADTAQEIGGDHVALRPLMGPGVDPHAYRQTRSDIVAMTRADLVLWHGLFLEAQMEDFFEDLARSRNVTAVAEVTPRELLLAHEDYANRFDPHLWMVPGLWRHAAMEIRDALIAADPENAQDYTANAETFFAALEALSDYATQSLSTVPEAQRVLVTAHDAFNYFGQAHGFEVLGIQGISTDSEAGLSRIAELVDLLVERNIAAVFVESSVSDRNIRALIEGAAARGHAVEIGGELYSDAMGDPGTHEGTYIGMIDHNVTVITRALGGEAPERGMSGRLSAGM